MDNLGFNLANPGNQKVFQQPYMCSASVSSASSSSSSSVFSFGSFSSQSSVSSGCDVVWENGASDNLDGITDQLKEGSALCSRGSFAATAAEHAVAPELRQHPRRSKPGTDAAYPRVKPSLVRQSDRRVNFVDNLVDSASQIVQTVWPLSAAASKSDSAIGCKGVLPLRGFIQETLRRSRTSYSTLQVALYYIILIRPRLPRLDFTMEQSQVPQCQRAMQCGRRMFLAALILASKYLQDRNYSARAWSKISGLSTEEINQNELTFLHAVGWKLHISESVFKRWTDIVLKYTPSSDSAFNGEGLSWRSIIPTLTPELDNLELGPTRGVVSIQDLLSPSPSPSPSRSPVYESGNTVNALTSTSGLEVLSIEPSSPIMLPVLPVSDLSSPQLSPQTLSNTTPAAGAVPILRGPSMSCAMRHAQTICSQRTMLDQRLLPRQNMMKSASFESYTRRSSLARSSSSSPESMVSDVPSLTSSRSSRSSRSSSISSVTSGTCPTSLPHLAMRTTRRRSNMKDTWKPPVIVSPINETEYSDIYASPEAMSTTSTDVPDMSNFSLASPVDLAREAAQSLCDLAGAIPRSTPSSVMHSPFRVSKKRGRFCSNDGSLHHNVRHLVALKNRQNVDDGNLVARDVRVADSFLLSKCTVGQAAPLLGPLGSLKTPWTRENEAARKRTCCGREAARFLWGMSNASTDNVVDMVE
ncbi:PHO85 cyclin-5 [Ophidiomyces ophidiicola]|nr:PHO85 cyclin-5 [Ophidiomyces ophidiicola]